MNPRDIVDPPPTIEPASSSSSESGEEELHAGLRPTSNTAGTGPSNPNQGETRNLNTENETEEQRLPENFEELTPPSETNIALRPENQVAAQSDPSDLVSAQLTNLVSLVHQLVNRQERHEQQLQDLFQSINPSRMRTGTRPSRVTLREGVTDGNLPRTRLNFNENGNLTPDLRPIETPLNNGIPPMFTPPTCTSAMGSNLASSSSQNLRCQANPSERELPSPPPSLPNGGPPRTVWMGSSAFASHSQVTPIPGLLPNRNYRQTSNNDTRETPVLSLDNNSGLLTYPPSGSTTYNLSSLSGSNQDYLRRCFEDQNLQIRKINSQIHRAMISTPEIDLLIEQTRRTPFTDRIANAYIRDNRRIRFPEYDGTKDPRAYLKAFRLTITRAHLTDEEREAAHCRFFAENLTGSALEWFSSLEGNSIDSFEQLITALLKQYSVFLETEASEADLWEITQTKGQSLRTYIEKFKAARAKIHVVNHKVAIKALEKGLLHRSMFYKELALNPPETLDDVLHRASRFIALEEHIAAKEGRAPAQADSQAPKNQGKK
ncbi:hypothetical protein V5N11_018737 [Cardamine amara subsp. amara]|uniref:Retrotransposon gag domain-containing protein n=1 Tax=Cardamine amara subsp. amara TaxID=228776 RepID=A0ABD1BDF1_CARAN